MANRSNYYPRTLRLQSREVQAQDEEKIARCKGYIAEVKNEERRKWLIFLIPVFMTVLSIVVSIIGLIALIKVLSKVGY